MVTLWGKTVAEYLPEKRRAHARAVELLSRQDDSVLRYACLELRGCLEAVAYDKLMVYKKRLPRSVYKWQPPKLFKALLQIEPDADQSFVLRYSKESEPGVSTGDWKTFGEHRTFGIRWLDANYHKLGNYLHAPFPDEHGTVKQTDPKALREYVEKLIRELAPIVASSIDSSLAEIVEFQCIRCQQPIACNLKGVKRSKAATCLESNCGAEYFADDSSEPIKFVLKAMDFKCLRCDKPITVESRFLKVGYEFKCSECQSVHSLVSRQWGYGILDENHE
jgi:hypothetical protein